jgi:phage shock protein A
MAETTTSTRRKAGGAKDKDFVSRLADAGEEALQRLADLPGGQRAVTAFNDLRTRVDELGRKVRGIEELETRVRDLEKEVAALKKAKAAPRRTTTRKPKPSA